MTAQSKTSSQRPLILVTGAGGLIGDQLVKAFSDDFRVVGLDLEHPGNADLLTDWFEIDLTDDDSTGHALTEVKRKHGGHVASMLHLAAYYDFSGEPSPLYQTLTVDGTRRLLRQFKQQDFQVEQFVFSSSLLVMKPGNDGKPFNETSPTEAKWDYPQSKLAAEEAIREQRGDTPTVILRLAGVYDEDCHSLPIAQQMRRIYEKQLESYMFPGNLKHGQAFLHLEDLQSCYRCVVERRDRLAPEELFLVAEPDVVSYGEMQERLGEALHGENWPTIRIPKFVAKAGAMAIEKLEPGEEEFIKPWMIDLADDHYAADVSHAREELGWEPRHRLRDTLEAMAESLKRDPQRWYEINNLPVPVEVESR